MKQDSADNLKRTPLYHCHEKLGAKIVPFAGWEMPLQYTGIVAEHNAVRREAGIFDVSHMGEIFVTGSDAEAALDYLTCNDVKGLTDGKAHYTAITNHKGGVVDDVIVYRITKNEFLICVNAANTDKDFAWLTAENRTGAAITNRSSEFGQIALQGPRAIPIVKALVGSDIGDAIPFFHHRAMKVLGADVIVARTGYTGEDGFEIFVPWRKASDLWQALLEVGTPKGLIPAGLGARDTLRLEASLPLYGHELHDDVTAVESGIGWVVKPEKKGDFCGRKVLEKQKRDGAPRTLIGFYLDGPGIAREGDSIVSSDGRPIGRVTSGTKTPYLNVSLGMGLVESGFGALGTKIVVRVRGRDIPSHVVRRPFYKRTS